MTHIPHAAAARVHEIVALIDPNAPVPEEIRRSPRLPLLRRACRSWARTTPISGGG